MDELRRQEREMFEARRQLQLGERRARRRNELKLRQPSDEVPILATTLPDIEAVTIRPGFLRQQLKMPSLTPLRRWHLQLQLMVAEDAKTHQGHDVENALQSLKEVLCRDRRCYDVVYREGVRVTDAWESLLDEGAPMDVREVLSFSTRLESSVCRVTCVHDGKRVLFSSTQYVKNLQRELERLLTENSSVDIVITFICSTVAV